MRPVRSYHYSKILGCHRMIVFDGLHASGADYGGHNMSTHDLHYLDRSSRVIDIVSVFELITCRHGGRILDLLHQPSPEGTSGLGQRPPEQSKAELFQK